jgi:hypothetical protein
MRYQYCLCINPVIWRYQASIDGLLNTGNLRHGLTVSGLPDGKHTVWSQPYHRGHLSAQTRQIGQ